MRISRYIMLISTGQHVWLHHIHSSPAGCFGRVVLNRSPHVDVLNKVLITDLLALRRTSGPRGALCPLCPPRPPIRGQQRRGRKLLSSFCSNVRRITIATTTLDFNSTNHLKEPLLLRTKRHIKLTSERKHQRSDYTVTTPFSHGT